MVKQLVTSSRSAIALNGNRTSVAAPALELIGEIHSEDRSHLRLGSPSAGIHGIDLPDGKYRAFIQIRSGQQSRQRPPEGNKPL
ncbi:MAG: hypothetical protein HC873_07660 [Leptolyngbyaceae cyanobacterium SL_1_1]|nr:hypothetical protein [Leptolyngbyaceae cyanobacterium RM1_1_2]NJO09544.1 hypothetical protein [Leptolyngbyaceae cyanobacterium SL_1_1]